jgi:hypothetical protein
MVGTAVVVAGVPARALKHLRTEFDLAFPNGFLFRAAAAEVRSNRLASYSDELISVVVGMLADAVFGHSSRPVGFCRNKLQPCAIASKGRHTCKKADKATCNLSRPDFVILVYQKGERQSELINRIYHSAFLIEIPEQFYGASELTAAFVLDQIRSATNQLRALVSSFKSGTCPLLLPPKNFGMTKHVVRLFAGVMAGKNVTTVVSDFRRIWFDRRMAAYIGRSKLAFKPAVGALAHGEAELQDDLALGLTSYYRLGCGYNDSFHWDVERSDRPHFDGTITFHCRKAGKPSYPSGMPNVNVLVDDSLR